MISLPPIPNLEKLRATTNQIVGYRTLLEKNLQDHTQEIRKLESEQEVLDLVATLFRQLIDQEIMSSVAAVEKLQTEGLQSVFTDQKLRVQSQVDILRGKVSVDLKVVQETDNGAIVEGSSKDTFGGSVMTVQSVIMRVIVALKHGLRPFFIMDEALPAFDANYVVNMAHFLKTLCSDLGLDMLLVSHNPLLLENADHAYRIKRVHGASKFVEVKSEI